MRLSDSLKKEAKDLTVLYAEDEDDTRLQISQILQLFFKDMYIGKNGKDALDLYKQNPVNLIITDLTMPKMNGIDMIKEIKKINPNQHIIILTAHNSSHNLMETIDLQIDGCLLKPMRMDKMLTLLNKVTHTINLERNEK